MKNINTEIRIISKTIKLLNPWGRFSTNPLFDDTTKNHVYFLCNAKNVQFAFVNENLSHPLMNF
jgi:hypothetical protein